MNKSKQPERRPQVEHNQVDIEAALRDCGFTVRQIRLLAEKYDAEMARTDRRRDPTATYAALAYKIVEAKAEILQGKIARLVKKKGQVSLKSRQRADEYENQRKKLHQVSLRLIKMM